MTQPNIIFILTDDLGWRDLTCYGSTFYETPNLDRLAREGMRFTDAYAACPVCSPTRASILTGRYPATVGVTDWIDWTGRIHPARGKLIDVPYLKYLPLQETTLASVLRAAGYATWHVGKWHLGGLHQAHIDNRTASIPGPLQHGFDHYLTQLEDPPIRAPLGRHRCDGSGQRLDHACARADTERI